MVYSPGHIGYVATYRSIGVVFPFSVWGRARPAPASFLSAASIFFDWLMTLPDTNDIRSSESGRVGVAQGCKDGFDAGIVTRCEDKSAQVIAVPPVFHCSIFPPAGRFHPGR
jgi:hypothetical protein